MSIYVPPGGFAGYAQQVPAAKAGQAGGRIARGGGRRRKRKGTKKRATAKARTKRRSGRKMLNGRRMTAKQAKYFGKRKRR